MTRSAATRSLALSLLIVACGDGKDGTTGASTGGTDDSTTTGSTSGTTTGTGSGTTCVGNCPTSATSPTTSSGTGTGTASGTGSTTDGMLPPICTATSDCPQGQHCLKKSCDDVDDEPGCGEFRCYAECSSPFDRTGFWTCADTQACCGGYPCEAGLCTEHFDTMDGG